jgi:hypothetical protein
VELCAGLHFALVLWKGRYSRLSGLNFWHSPFLFDASSGLCSCSLVWSPFLRFRSSILAFGFGCGVTFGFALVLLLEYSLLFVVFVCSTSSRRLVIRSLFPFASLRISFFKPDFWFSQSRMLCFFGIVEVKSLSVRIWHGNQEGKPEYHVLIQYNTV